MTDKSLKTQQGLTMVSWMVVIAIALFFVMIGLKMVPTYLENYSIKQVLEGVQNDRTLRDVSRQELKNIILKRFKINSVYDFNKDDLKLVTEKEGTRIEVNYEVRKPVAGNVAIVMTFHESLQLPSR